jgi:putative membrane protein
VLWGLVSQVHDRKSQPKIMDKTNTKNNKIRLFFTGLTMGIADLVPGVSGGTIAFVFGIYDELLYSIKLITGQVPKLILTGDFKKAISLMPFSFLIPLGLGLVSSIFGFVKIVSYLLEKHPTLLWSFFFGLVLGSVCIISRRITKWKISYILLLMLGFILTFVIVGLPSFNGNESLIAVFATGAIAITAMILPGISGSLIMVIFGQYNLIINAVAERNFTFLIIFAIGAIVGLALFVRLLTWLMKNHHSAVITFLIGVMIGSLRQVWPWQDVNINGIVTNVFPPINLSVFWPIMLAIIGFIIVFVLERIGVAKEYDYINTADFQNEFKNIKE